MRIESVILDRDGTVIADKHYLADPAGVELLPGAGEALASLRRAGIRLFVASNQSGIGRGYFGEADQRAVHARLEELLAAAGAGLDGAAFCPHAPEAGCACRKPAPGMFAALAREHGLDPAATAMVGDKADDVGFGLNAGLGLTILALTGKGREHAARLGLPALSGPCLVLADRQPDWPHALCADLAAAARLILELNRRGAQ